MRAEERVGPFLLNLSEGLTALGHSPSNLALRATGERIANLLEIDLETVRRIIPSKSQEDALIEIEGAIARREARYQQLHVRPSSKTQARSQPRQAAASSYGLPLEVDIFAAERMFLRSPIVEVFAQFLLFTRFPIQGGALWICHGGFCHILPEDKFASSFWFES